MKKLNIGDKCWMKQLKVPATIVAQYDENHWVVSSDNMQTNFVIYKGNCEPLMADIASVGDRVKSTIGSFIGTVVAIEEHSNRAICISDKISRYSDKRTRYSYSINEIKLLNKSCIAFRPGTCYKLNGQDDIWMACVDKAGDEIIHLVNISSGVGRKVIPKPAMHVNDLKTICGIDTIEVIVR